MIASEMQTTAPTKTTLIEQNKRLSQSHLWRMEREYFEKKGIEAWLHEVPFYITSNPFIARAYASIVINFMRDWIAKHPDAIKHPFYIMELGTGPGRFSYYMVKVLQEMRRDSGLEDLSIIYVMTDFTKANIEYYESHHALMPFVQQGLIDFAILDMEKQDAIQLVNSKTILDQATLVNPISVFANYVFDTLPNDAFSIRHGKLFELLVSLSTDNSNMENNLPVELDKIQVDHHEKELASSTYYNDPAIDGILELYKQTLTDTSLLLPIAAIRGLDFLRKLSNNNMLLISSDKGYSELATLENLAYPSMSIHGGCFSMMANCHAIGQFFKNSGGDFFPQPIRRGLKTCVYTSGATLSELPHTRLAIRDNIEKFSPTDYFNLYRHASETAENAELDVLASALELSGWDPHYYSRISSRILSIVNESEPDTVNFMVNNMHRLVENYYYMPKVDCILFEVGVFYHALKRYDQAVAYYQQAEQFIGEQFSLYYNTALCLHHLDKNKDALEFFKRAMKLDPSSKEASDWVDYLKKMFMEQKYEPKGVY